MNLIVSRYQDKDAARQRELDHCLQENCANELIDHVFLLEEGEVDLPDLGEHAGKVQRLRVDHRPTYAELFATANLFATPDTVSVIANSDIFFTETLGHANVLQPDECWALTRWNRTDTGRLQFMRRRDSQDAWLFRGPIRAVKADFTMGRPGCDNAVLHLLWKAGYKVGNPSQTVRAIHLHLSEVRNFDWNDVACYVPRPYLLIEPHPFDPHHQPITYELL